ncbi:hypothetical protein [Aquibacillus saliphilus]|uniref:hypothetical protein n=1 Tax=Aquibacillus saliphilus TaxID=1909422 RepID=UPI001CF0A68D|nr:hypothetical protein [Aquibacillus saliphilus]
MGIFGRKGEIQDDTVKDKGVVIGTVTIKRENRQNRSVKAVVVECATSEELFKVTYKSNKSDVFTYNVACEYIHKFIKDNDYVLTGDITSVGVDLPSITTISKRTR